MAGFLAERSFVWLFVGEAVTSTVLGVLALIVLPEGVRARRHEEDPGVALRTIRRDRPFVLFLAAGVLAGPAPGPVPGAYGLTFALAHILAPAVGTSLYAWSPMGLWLICGAVGVISAALIAVLPERRIREPYVEPPDIGPEVPGAER